MNNILITLCFFVSILPIQGCGQHELESGIYSFKEEMINPPSRSRDPTLIEIWVTDNTFKIYRESGGLILSGHQDSGHISFTFAKESRERPRNIQMIYSGKVDSSSFASGTITGAITNEQSIQVIDGNWSLQKRSEFPPQEAGSDLHIERLIDL